MYPVSFTAVYMTPRLPEPRLHRVVHIPQDVLPELAKASADQVLQPLKSLQRPPSNSTMEIIAEDIAAACREVEARQEVHDLRFKLLGVLAIYQTNIYMAFATAFYDRMIMDALARRQAKALGTMVLLLQPEDNLHPVLNEQLF